MSEDPTKNLLHEDLRLILTRLDSIDTRLTALEDKVDRRLQETRPIWEQVLTRLEGVETRLEGVETRLEGFDNEMRSGFRRLERQVGLLAEDVMIVRADQRDLEKRMSKLEPEPAQ